MGMQVFSMKTLKVTRAQAVLMDDDQSYFNNVMSHPYKKSGYFFIL
jgi:hypothetical protein